MIFIFDDNKEPEDIFAETPSGKGGVDAPPPNLPTPSTSQIATNGATFHKGTTPLPVGESGVIVEESAFGKKLVFGGVIVGIILIGFGVWYFVFYDRGASVQVNQGDFTELRGDVFSPPPSDVPQAPPDETIPQSDDVADEPSVPPASEGTGASDEGVMPSVPPGEEAGVVQDADKDGLTDAEEVALGTDPRNPDTDGDGLNDREEVRTYGTDPTNPDTDGDGFNDGSEVQNGYDPNGPGRLLQIPQ